jgi:broad specificity phosphatase PhoE
VIGRLLLVRHGVTTWNREGRFQGHLDPPLDPLGELEAAALAQRVVREFAETIALASSPLQRAVATAAILRQALAADDRPVEVQLEQGLMELGQGAWEGRTHADLAATDGDRYRAWAATSGWHEPPGGEAAPAAAARAVQAVRNLVAQQDAGSAETLCCVSHGGILRLIAGRLTGASDHAAWGLEVDNASLSVLERTASGWRIALWNDTSHLAPELPAEDRRAEGSPRAL